MISAKIVYLARYRVPHAIMSMQFSHYLKDVERTCIASPVPQAELWPLFERYNIDTSQFDYVHDKEIYRVYPEVNNWIFEGDYRTYWLRQQAIKLAFLDYLDYDLMIMHDPDCILIQDYWPMKDGKLNYMVLENERHSWGYYETIKNALGFERRTNHCFISKIFIILKIRLAYLYLYLSGQNHILYIEDVNLY